LWVGEAKPLPDTDLARPQWLPRSTTQRHVQPSIPTPQANELGLLPRPLWPVWARVDIGGRARWSWHAIFSIAVRLSPLAHRISNCLYLGFGSRAVQMYVCMYVSSYLVWSLNKWLLVRCIQKMRWLRCTHRFDVVSSPADQCWWCSRNDDQFVFIFKSNRELSWKRQEKILQKRQEKA
jgi:hypothetical protein